MPNVVPVVGADDDEFLAAVGQNVVAIYVRAAFNVDLGNLKPGSQLPIAAQVFTADRQQLAAG